MRKGIFFSLLFGAFFTLVLSLSLYFAVHLSESERIFTDMKKYNKFGFMQDDISGDLKEIMQIGDFEIQKNGSLNTIIIYENIPSQFSNPSAEISSYKIYIEGDYAKRNNMQGKLVLKAESLGAPFIFFKGPNFNYSYAGIAKQASLFKTGPSVLKYSISIVSDEPISSCGWSQQNSGAVWVSINFNSANCVPQSLQINPLMKNSFFANTSSGKIVNLTFGLSDQEYYSYKIEPNGANLKVQTNLAYTGSTPVYAYLPVGIDFGDYETSTLPLIAN